jgi:eukaryotic-like serine/threonine-protein kinase
VASAAFAHDELILGRYRPLRPLGSGGMGHVWLARDERTGLDLALKMVGREGKASARAEREARAAAALRHPRCQRIHALARDPGHVYIAYEYVPGRTLRQALAAGALADREVVEVAAQVLEALAHAHAQGIVHRDVKPSNVLVAEADEIDVRLLDFGLAQMAEFDTLTAMGDVPGTLAYVSPERLLGKPATPAADVWAVGVMLWEALAGRHPLRGATMSETTRLIQAGAPPLQTARPDLPPALCAAVGAALALNPARRPDAKELAAELRCGATRHRTLRPAAPAALAPRLPTLARERALPAALAAAWTCWVAARLPFYPAGWPLGLAVAAGVLTAAAPRAGLAFALASAVLPLGNNSLGLALLYGALAAAWLAVCWRDSRAGLVVAAGPLLASIGALAFVPFAALTVRGAARRALQTAVAVLLAALVAGLGRSRLPFDETAPPPDLGITASPHPIAVASALADTLGAHPALLAEAAILAACAAALPYVRGRGVWPAACAGAAFLAATALAAPAAPFLPLAAAAWALAAFTAVPPRAA